jgi:hypothetical protein
LPALCGHMREIVARVGEGGTPAQGNIVLGPSASL